MASKKAKAKLEKKEWKQNFALVGVAKIGDYTFKIDEKSTKSDYVYNSLNLGVDCGEKHGIVYAEMMGGYSAEKERAIWVHGKKEDGTDDFENTYTIDWDDRFDDDVLSEIGDTCFITVGLEKTTDNKTFYNKFLSPYDAIAYIKEHLSNETVIRVSGQIKYSLYNESLQTKKIINNIVLSKAEPEKYEATFKQTMLLNKNSLGKQDKNKHIFPITGILLEKFKEYNGNDLTEGGKIKSGQFVPLKKVFEFEYAPSLEDKIKDAVNKVFKVEKNITQITFIGEFIEGGAIVTMTEDDLPSDIKDLVDLGYYTLEDALDACSDNTNKERRMILRKPDIRKVEVNDKIVPKINKIEDRYSEDDLIRDYLFAKNEEEEEAFETDESDTEIPDDDDDWLNALN